MSNSFEETKRLYADIASGAVEAPPKYEVGQRVFSSIDGDAWIKEILPPSESTGRIGGHFYRLHNDRVVHETVLNPEYGQ